MKEKPARETTIVTTLTVTRVLRNETDADGVSLLSRVTPQEQAEGIAEALRKSFFISPDNVQVENVQVFSLTDEPARAKPQDDAERPMVIAVDFDGTLCENAWPCIGAEKPAVIAYCLGARIAGCKLILWTNRTGERLREAVAWCAVRGLRFDAVNENLPEAIERFGGDTRKIVADVYLDDKAWAAHEIEKAWTGFQTAIGEDE